MERTIFHSDLNNFYAEAECLRRPELSGKPVAVCGDPSLRRGVVLAKNGIAKQCGVKTGDVIWEARQKCAGLVVVSADFPLYLRLSREVRGIYDRYTDRVEPFGIDECWLDVTGCPGLKGGARALADEIRAVIEREVGITASIGVSWNKVFAKLGSDLKKPNATTVIDRENYRQLIFGLPAAALLYAGKVTCAKLEKLGIRTIGQIASADRELLHCCLGKWGDTLHTFANGMDSSPVAASCALPPAKSLGNSTTTARDLRSEEDALIAITAVAESVAMRLREQNLRGRVVCVNFRDSNLRSFSRQMTLERPTNLSTPIIEAAMSLLREYGFDKPLRSVGVKLSDLTEGSTGCQMSMFLPEEQVKKQERLEQALDNIKLKFGQGSIKRGTLCIGGDLAAFRSGEERIIPPGYTGRY